MSFDRSALAGAVAAHGTVTRVVIAAHSGSAPRETGTAMLVWAGGQSGTIGGGALEHAAAARARKLAAADGPWRRDLLRQPLGPALGQCCGGSVTLLFEAFTEAELAALPEAGLFARPVSSRDPFAGAPPLAIAKARRAARSGEGGGPLLADGWFAEPLAAALTPLWIWGAGHVGRALVATLQGLPFAITWVDTDRSRFPEETPPCVDILVAANPAEAARHAPDIAQHLVLTYSHALDLEICHAVLSRPFASLGLIGSATKKARFLKRLEELGHSPAQRTRLDCPIGDPALGKHPQAIAASVVHELLIRQAAADQSGSINRGRIA